MITANLHHPKELEIYQEMSLDAKIRKTRNLIKGWYDSFDGKVYISFSGGKDSTVLLDLVRRAFPDIQAVFVDTGLEYPEIRAFVKTISNVEWLKPAMPFNKVIEKYGYPVISKETAEDVYYARHGSEWAINRLKGLNANGSPSKFKERYKKWACLVDAPFPISHYCCAVMKKKPFHLYVKQTGKMPIVGTLAHESALRRTAYLKSGCNTFDSKNPISKPMSFWLEQDVLHYLKMTGIPYCSIYGDIIEEKGKLRTTGADRTGCMFCMFGVHREKQPNRFQRMEQIHPKQYNYYINKLGCGAVLDYIGIPYKGGVTV